METRVGSSLYYLVDTTPDNTYQGGIIHTKLFLEILKNGTVSAYIIKRYPVANVVDKAEKMCDYRSLRSIICFNDQISNFVLYDYLSLEGLQIRDWSEMKILSESREMIYRSFSVEIEMLLPSFRLYEPFQRTWLRQPIFPFVIFPNISLTTKSSKITATISMGRVGVLLQEVKLETKGFRFVTCANIYEYGKFSLYPFHSQFEPGLWLVLAMFAVTTGIVLKLFQNVLTHGKTTTFVFPVASLLEQGIQLPRGKASMISVTWIIMAVILSNGYKGDNITMVTAPRTVNKLEKYDQLIQLNFRYYNDLYGSSEHIQRAHQTLKNHNVSQHEVNVTFQLCNYRTPQSVFSSDFQRTYVKKLSNVNQTIVEKIFESLIMYLPSATDSMVTRALNTLNHKRALLSKISECKRDAYLGEFDESQKFYSSLKKKFNDKASHVNKRKLEMLTISKETLGSLYLMWTFINFPVEPKTLSIRLQSFLASGIQGLWDSWTRRMSMWNETVAAAKMRRDPVTFSIYGHGVVIFYSYLVLIAAAGGCLAAEFFWRSYSKLHEWLIPVDFSLLKSTRFRSRRNDSDNSLLNCYKLLFAFMCTAYAKSKQLTGYVILMVRSKARHKSKNFLIQSCNQNVKQESHQSVPKRCADVLTNSELVDI